MFLAKLIKPIQTVLHSVSLTLARTISLTHTYVTGPLQTVRDFRPKQNGFFNTYDNLFDYFLFKVQTLSSFCEYFCFLCFVLCFFFHFLFVILAGVVWTFLVEQTETEMLHNICDRTVFRLTVRIYHTYLALCAKINFIAYFSAPADTPSKSDHGGLFTMCVQPWKSESSFVLFPTAIQSS